MECNCLPCLESKLIVRQSEAISALRRKRDEMADVVAILLLNHQRVSPHHSDMCDVCRVAKDTLEVKP